MVEAMTFPGEGVVVRTAEVERLTEASPADLTALNEDRRWSAERVPAIPSAKEAGDRMADGTLWVFALRDQNGWAGSMALERGQVNGHAHIRVVWLRVEAGRASRVLKELILGCWRELAVVEKVERFVLQGPRGWEHILIQGGVNPTELSRVWTFKV